MASSPPTPPQPARRRVEYTADFERKMDRVLEKQTDMQVAIEQIRGSIKPRQEIDAEIDQRVHVDAYRIDRENDEKRFKKLEDAPSAVWLRAGIVISGGIGCLGLLGTCVSIVVTILIASHIIN